MYRPADEIQPLRMQSATYSCSRPVSNGSLTGIIRSPARATAIDNQVGSGHVRGGVRNQEHHRGLVLVRPGHAAEWDQCRQVLDEPLILIREHTTRRQR